MTRECVRLLATSDRPEWQSSLRAVSNGEDPFFSPGFYSAIESHSRCPAVCFVYENGGETVVYPFLKRPLNRLPFMNPDVSWSDVTGGYGYNGALSSSTNKEFLDSFRQRFHAYCEEEMVITEFTRFNPLLNNAAFFVSDATIVSQNQNVAVRLNRPLHEVRARYKHNCRKNIKKAIREGVQVYGEVGLGPSFNEFLRVYGNTTRRVGARPGDVYGRECIEILLRELDPAPLIAYAKSGGEIVSVELVLRSGRILYSYLGGTEETAFDLRPNNLLRDFIIEWGHRSGAEWYLLGGGRTRGDSLFKYKSTFAPEGGIDFEIGYRIHAIEAYQNVLALWDGKTPAPGCPNQRVQCYWEESETSVNSQ